jgi:hypothetical protein
LAQLLKLSHWSTLFNARQYAQHHLPHLLRHLKLKNSSLIGRLWRQN